jgi:cysteinyl-tRNA synthetase
MSTMLALKLHNTLSGRKEEFVPLVAGKASLYHCGPTVYNFAHIGNLRMYVFADILRRTLEWNDYEVRQIINITDIGHLTSDADNGDDKMTKALLREGKPLTLEAMKEVAMFYENAFKDDLKALNILEPTAFPRASEHINEDIELIKTLSDKGFIYETSDGLYFDVSKFSEYGKLGGLTEEFKKKIDSHFERIKENSEKRNPRDFAVWKKNDLLGWHNPVVKDPNQKGFPGWHIECSAMSMKYLGQTFDIHTGGIDHIPVHHNNEIAQSESATGIPFARYWMHGNFLNIDSEKISKSLGNDIYLKSIVEKGISPVAYRYWLLTANYRTEVNFSWESIEASASALKRLIDELSELPEDGSEIPEYKEKFSSFINDDLNMPKALALVWELLKDTTRAAADKRATILCFDKVFGLNLTHEIHQKNNLKIPPHVLELIDKRDAARKEKNWSESDRLRTEIASAGFEIKDVGERQIISLLIDIN